MSSSGVFKGWGWAHPPFASVKYMLYGGFGPLPPLKRKRKVSPSWEKNLNPPLLTSLKLDV